MMPFPQFDRNRLRLKPLRERKNRVFIERDHVDTDSRPKTISEHNAERIKVMADEIRKSKRNKRSIIMTFGAHCIKNGLAPVLIKLIKKGWITHLATNGAGIIHDWEFAYLGESSENVQENVARGQFGLWEETGFYINLALAVGAYNGLGYGEAVGFLVYNDGVTVPEKRELLDTIKRAEENPERAAAACDLLDIISKHSIGPGFFKVEHIYKRFGLQSCAYELGLPYTAHPMFGHDIIYTHPLNHGAALGRTAERDFLSFAESVQNIEGGVYLSVGSAVMSPMIFEKSFSMAQNLHLQKGSAIGDYKIFVVDLSEADWDWNRGEPPESNPAYYVRFLKSFSRLGGDMTYLQMDNRDFLLALYNELNA
jgi:hypothetical protein